MLKNFFLVAFGGGLGSVGRYFISFVFATKKFPFATFSVNMIGSFLIGFLMSYIIKQANGQTWQMLLITGFCGGFTTFSAFSWEVVSMLQQQRYTTATLYISATLILGFLFTALGFWCYK
jgi:CrcB protein